MVFYSESRYHLRPMVRKDWIQKTQFISLSDREVLEGVAARVRRGNAPVVLFDLDSTLYEVAPRTLAILRDWMVDRATPFHQVPNGEAYRQGLEALQLQHIGYSLKDTFLALGFSIEDQAARKLWHSAKEFWRVRFFGNDYLKHDHAYVGAVDYVKHIYEIGGEIVYLTGRDSPGMRQGTVQNLIRDGFPWKGENFERIRLMMKPHRNADDMEFKREAGRLIHQHAPVEASFENEPKNIVALMQVFPEAHHVFVDTVCSDHPADPVRGIYRISGFEMGPSLIAAP